MVLVKPTAVLAFQLHVMDSSTVSTISLATPRARPLSTPCNGFKMLRDYLKSYQHPRLSTPCNGFGVQQATG